jgi:hypothetical protein
VLHIAKTIVHFRRTVSGSIRWGWISYEYLNSCLDFSLESIRVVLEVSRYDCSIATQSMFFLDVVEEHLNQVGVADLHSRMTLLWLGVLKRRAYIWASRVALVHEEWYVLRGLVVCCGCVWVQWCCRTLGWSQFWDACVTTWNVLSIQPWGSWSAKFAPLLFIFFYFS